MDLDPQIWLKDPAPDQVPVPDPSILSVTFNAHKTYIFSKFFCLLLFEKKVIKKSQNSRNQGFSYYFCLMIEGSRTIPRTYGSGWPKNMRILIRITGCFHKNPYALTIPAIDWQWLNKLSSLPTASAQGSSWEDSGNSSCIKNVSKCFVRVQHRVPVPPLSLRIQKFVFITFYTLLYVWHMLHKLSYSSAHMGTEHSVKICQWY